MIATVVLVGGVICLIVVVAWRIRLKPAELNPIVKSDHPTSVFVLVHGTFASSAKWTKAKSKLVARILSISNESIAVYSFVWWGRNSPRRRLYYAEEFAKNLHDLREKHRTAAITVVAHSHGGAVSLKALELCGPTQDDIRLACLSTPFLHVRDRSPGLLDGVRVFAKGTFLVGGVVACAPIANIGDRFHWSMTTWVVCSVLALLAVPSIGFWLVAYMGRFVRSKGDKLRRDLSVRVSPTRKLLLVRMTGDEASSFLSAYTFFDWLLEKMMSIWHAIDGPLRRRKQSIWEAILVFTGLAALLFALANHLRVTDDQGAVFMAVGLLAGPALALLSSILAVALTVLCILPMGWSAACGVLTQTISVESSPIGPWTVELFMPTPFEAGLRHSSTYEDENCLHRIGQWCARPTPPEV